MTNNEKPPEHKHDVLVEYHKTNSIGGLPQSYASYYKFFKVLWILFVLVGLGATGYHAYTIIKGYFKYPIQVTISIKTNDSLVVPSVTVCNLNPVRKSKVECNSKLARLAGLQQIPMDYTLKHKDLDTLYKNYVANSPNVWVFRKEDWLTNLLEMGRTKALLGCQSFTGSPGSSPSDNLTDDQPPPSNTSNSGGSNGQPPSYKNGESNGSLPANNNGGSIGQAPPNTNGGSNGQPPPNNNGGSNGQPPPNNDGGSNGQPPPKNNEQSGSPQNNNNSSQAESCPLNWNPKFYYCNNKSMLSCDEVKDGVSRDNRDIYFLDEIDGRLFLCQPFIQRREICKPLVFCSEDDTSDGVESGKTSPMIVEDAFDFRTLLEDTTLDDFMDVRDVFAFEGYMDKLGYEAEDFIVECTYDRTKCLAERDFGKMMDKQYGNCFTFNRAQGDMQSNKTSKSGSTYGLRLTLNIDADEYLGLLASEYGVRVSVHHPSVKPVPENVGFVARPGMMTEASVKLRELKRLPKPFETECLTEYPSEYKTFADPNAAYTIKQCQLACVDKNLLQHCGCIQQVHPHDFTYKQCSLFDVSTRNCSLALHMNFSQYFKCDCPPQCHEYDYSISLSNSIWPSDPYGQIKMGSFFGRQKLATIMLTKVSNNESDWIKRNLVRLQVYYQSLTYETIKQEKAYATSRLWSDLGGVLGLYLGMSVVTLAEFFQLVIMLIITGNGKKREKVRVEKVYDMTSAPAPRTRFPEKVELF